MVDFKSSFIPRRPIVEGGQSLKRHSAVSPATIGGIIILLLTIGAYGGLFGYRLVLKKNIIDKTAAIERTKQQIDPRSIEELKKFDAQLETASNLLNSHVILSGFFAFLEENTLQTVRFDRLSYILNAGGGVDLKMTGESKGYAALALQGDAFSKDGFVQRPIFSNLRLNDKGNVLFEFTATVSNEALLYSTTLKPDASEPSLDIKIDDGTPLEDGTLN